MLYRSVFCLFFWFWFFIFFFFGAQVGKQTTMQHNRKLCRERERDRSVAVLPLKFDFFPFAYYCKSCCWYVLIPVHCQLCAFGVLLWANYSYYIFIFIISFFCSYFFLLWLLFSSWILSSLGSFYLYFSFIWSAASSYVPSMFFSHLYIQPFCTHRMAYVTLDFFLVLCALHTVCVCIFAAKFCYNNNNKSSEKINSNE